MNEAVAYLLGELSSEDAAAFERELAADPALREEVERLKPIVTRLDGLPADAWQPLEPPPLALTAERPPRRRVVLRPVVALACALALLAAGAGVGLLLDRDDPEQPPSGERLALAPLDAAPGARGDALLSARDDEVTLEVSGLAPSADGFYELWLIGADDRLVSLGSFPVGAGGTAKLRLPLPVDPAAYTFFDVSREPDDGDPGHSGKSVLRGPASS